MLVRQPTHYYVYVLHRDKDGVWYAYERTCASEDGAKDRVAELARRGIEAIYLINFVIKDAFY